MFEKLTTRRTTVVKEFELSTPNCTHVCEGTVSTIGRHLGGTQRRSCSLLVLVGSGGRSLDIEAKDQFFGPGNCAAVHSRVELGGSVRESERQALSGVHSAARGYPP